MFVIFSPMQISNQLSKVTVQTQHPDIVRSINQLISKLEISSHRAWIRSTVKSYSFSIKDWYYARFQRTRHSVNRSSHQPQINSNCQKLQHGHNILILRNIPENLWFRIHILSPTPKRQQLSKVTALA